MDQKKLPGEVFLGVSYILVCAGVRIFLAVFV